MDNLLAENCQDNFLFSMETFCVLCILAKTKSLDCFFFKIMNMSLLCFVSSHPQLAHGCLSLSLVLRFFLLKRSFSFSRLPDACS